MGASSQSHSGQRPLPYQGSRIRGARSPAETAYSLRLGDAGAGGSSTTRPMLRPMRAPAGSLRRARFRAKRACRGAFRPFQALWPDCAGSGAAGGPPAARGHGPGVSGHPAGVVEGARSSISMPSPRLNAGARTPRHHHQPGFEPLPLERRIDPGVLTATPRQEHERRRTVSDRCEGRKRKASAARSVATSECLCRYHVEKEHISADLTLRAAAREAELDRDPRAAEAGHLGAPPRVPSRS